MELQDHFKNAKAYVWKGTFAICKSTKAIPDAFANIIDKDEITVIINQQDMSKHTFDAVEKDYNVLTLDVIFPHNVVGVTATIANCLANKGISIMPIAAFSRDHFLIKTKDIKNAIVALQTLGITCK